ncbi:carbohydrate sulfotransferase 9-like [Branchiostoma floridae x Branchiostoma belcheri]
MLTKKTFQHLLTRTPRILTLCVILMLLLTNLFLYILDEFPSTSTIKLDKTKKNFTDVSLEESERRSGRNLLKENCRTRSEASMTPLSQVLRNLVVIDRYKVLYCRAGKTGSWTTLQLLYNLELNTNISRHEVRKLALEKPLPVLSDFSEKDIQLRLATYKKFLVARNPLERMASVWSGFFATYPWFGWNEKYQSMMETICPNTTAKKVVCDRVTEIKGIGNQTHQLVPFRAFAKAVAAAGNITKFSNPHWTPINKICSPCLLQYDFVAHTESLAEDLRTFFQIVGVSEKNNIFPQKRTRIGDKMLLEVFKKVSIEDIYRIGERYKDEYAFFGYSFEDDLQKLIHVG